MVETVRQIPKTGSAMALATRELVGRLHGMQAQEFVSYANLKALTGIDDQEHLIRLLRTARRYLRRQYQQEFEPIPGRGMLCLTERGKLGYAQKRRREIHNRAKTNVEILQAVDQTQLTSAEKYLHLAELSVNGAVSLATHEQTIVAIEAQHEPQPVLIDPRTYKDLFKGL